MNRKGKSSTLVRGFNLPFKGYLEGTMCHAVRWPVVFSAVCEDYHEGWCLLFGNGIGTCAARINVLHVYCCTTSGLPTHGFQTL